MYLYVGQGALQLFIANTAMAHQSVFCSITVVLEAVWYSPNHSDVVLNDCVIRSCEREINVINIA